MLGDPFEHGARLERERVLVAGVERGLDLGPRERRRDRRLVAQPQRVRAHRRLVPVVLAPVDEHLARALGLRHVDEHALGIARLEQLTEREREPLGVVVGRVRAVDRHRQVQSLAARRLHDALQVELRQRVAQLERDAAAVDDRRGLARDRGRSPSRSGARDRRASTGGCAARARRGSRATRASGGRRRGSPWCRRWPRCPGAVSTHSGWCDGQFFSKNRGPSGPSGRPHQGGRPPGEVGEDEGRDPAVVVDDVGFAEPGCRVEHLVEVRERELAALDLDQLAVRLPLAISRITLCPVPFGPARSASASCRYPCASSARPRAAT